MWPLDDRWFFPVFVSAWCCVGVAKVTCAGFLRSSREGKTSRPSLYLGGGVNLQKACGHRLLPAPPPLSSSSPSSPSSSSAAAAAASSRCLPAASMKKVPPQHGAAFCHDGPQAIFCVDVSILRYFSDQIWIMHLIFLATLLVSTLSLWLHPLLASSGTYAALAWCLSHHFHVLQFAF